LRDLRRGIDLGHRAAICRQPRLLQCVVQSEQRLPGLNLVVQADKDFGDAAARLGQLGRQKAHARLFYAFDLEKAAIARVFEATWQRCRVHWMRNALAYVSRGRHTVVVAIRQAFDQPDRANAGETWRKVAEQLRPRWPKLADLMDDSEHDVLAYMSFPRLHRTKLHSTNPIERLNKEVKRRADVVGIFPNEASIMRLIGAVLFEQNDEWQTASRYMLVEAFAQIDTEEIDPILSITTKAA